MERVTMSVQELSAQMGISLPKAYELVKTPGFPTLRMKQANAAWFQIFQVVKENCAVELSGRTPQDDVMERLLRARMGQKHY